jgi:hypothetical protein
MKLAGWLIGARQPGLPVCKRVRFPPLRFQSVPPGAPLLSISLFKYPREFGGEAPPSRKIPEPRFDQAEHRGTSAALLLVLLGGLFARQFDAAGRVQRCQVVLHDLPQERRRNLPVFVA